MLSGLSSTMLLGQSNANLSMLVADSSPKNQGITLAFSESPRRKPGDQPWLSPGFRPGLSYSSLVRGYRSPDEVKVRQASQWSPSRRPIRLPRSNPMDSPEVTHRSSTSWRRGC